MRRTPDHANHGRLSDATSRGVYLALMAQKGEMGYPTALTASGWGFQDVLFNRQEMKLARLLGSYVMENVLFKVSYPAEFHAQTAAECAVRLHPEVKDRIEDIDRITIMTHESAIRIIDKKGRFTIRLTGITASSILRQSGCFSEISRRIIMKRKRRLIRELIHCGAKWR